MKHRGREPLAIVGMAGFYPGATDLQRFWENLARGKRSFGEGDRARGWSLADFYSADGAHEDQTTARVAAFLDEVEVEVARYGIPPVQALSIARAQLLVLEVVDRCLRDGGFLDKDFDRDRTDVITGCTFGFDRTYANALRVESAMLVARFVEALRDLVPEMDDEDAERVARGLKERYRGRFGGAAHDRIGEMASTIPARISVAYKLRGRGITVDSADATSFAALRIAATNLRQRETDLAIVAVAQVLDSPLTPIALSKKGYLSSTAAVPFSRHQSGYTLGEGVGAVLLKRLDDAVRDGDRIWCVLGGVGMTHSSRRGSFRYSGVLKDRCNSIREALGDAGYEPWSIQYVECFASGLPGETDLEIEALSTALSSAGTTRHGVLLGSVKENIGHTFANSGLAALTKVALSLAHKKVVAQTALDDADTMDLSRTQFVVARKARAWPENAEGLPRRALISGASLTGTNCHLAIEEYVSPQNGSRHLEAFAEAPVPEKPRFESARDEDRVAVVGVGGAFADAPTAVDFWRNILDKHDALAPLSGDVLDPDVYYSPGNLDVFKTYSNVGSKVREPDLDQETFRLLPRRLLYMDAAQKLALAASREAFETFGFPAKKLPDRRTTVVMATNLSLNYERRAAIRIHYGELEEILTLGPDFARLSRVAQARVLEYLRQSMRDRVPPVSTWSLDGYLASGVAAVVSNEFMLNAVPLAVEAACASSLGALDIAVRGLVDGQFDFAVAGGVELPVNPRDMVICSSLGLLSPSRIAPFDERADGFSPGEGIGVFVLKRLADARRDSDRIFAVLRAVGSSCDAKSLIAPDDEGQALAIRRAFDKVDFGPDSVQFIETHGTGTTIGDVTEVRAIGKVYKNGHRPVPLALGSVKSMIGHTFSAAGAAGLLKAVCALDSKTLPPNIFLDHLNPKLELDTIPAYVNTETKPWPAPSTGPRRAAVSSMGTGGINYHVLLEEASQDG